MNRIFAAVALIVSTLTAQQQFQPEDIRNDPEFSPGRIQLHIWQGDWIVKRQEFRKTAGEVVSCRTDNFHIYHINGTSTLLQEVLDDEFFCRWEVNISKDTQDKDVVFVVVIQMDEKLLKLLKKSASVKLPDENFKLYGSRNGQDYREHSFFRDDLMNRVVCEIYSITRVIRFSGKKVTQ